MGCGTSGSVKITPSDTLGTDVGFHEPLVITADKYMSREDARERREEAMREKRRQSSTSAQFLSEKALVDQERLSIGTRRSPRYSGTGGIRTPSRNENFSKDVADITRVPEEDQNEASRLHNIPADDRLHPVQEYSSRGGLDVNGVDKGSLVASKSLSDDDMNAPGDARTEESTTGPEFFSTLNEGTSGTSIQKEGSGMTYGDSKGVGIITDGAVSRGVGTIEGDVDQGGIDHGETLVSAESTGQGSKMEVALGAQVVEEDLDQEGSGSSIAESSLSQEGQVSAGSEISESDHQTSRDCITDNNNHSKEDERTTFMEYGEDGASDSGLVEAIPHGTSGHDSQATEGNVLDLAGEGLSEGEVCHTEDDGGASGMELAAGGDSLATEGNALDLPGERRSRDEVCPTEDDGGASGMKPASGGDSLATGGEALDLLEDGRSKDRESRTTCIKSEGSSESPVPATSHSFQDGAPPIAGNGEGDGGSADKGSLDHHLGEGEEVKVPVGGGEDLSGEGSDEGVADMDGEEVGAVAQTTAA